MEEAERFGNFLVVAGRFVASGPLGINEEN